MKKGLFFLLLAGVLFADEKVLTEQEYKQRIDEIKMKTILAVEKTMLELLEEVKKEPITPLNSIANITLYQKQEDSKTFGTLKAQSIAFNPSNNLENFKDSEIVGKCYGAIYNDEKINNTGIDKVISTSQCIGELTAIKLIIKREIK
ncbi:MAG: hypothetical protein AB7V77_05240 [Candidatus Woesearchaeota archaeon]